MASFTRRPASPRRRPRTPLIVAGTLVVLSVTLAGCGSTHAESARGARESTGASGTTQARPGRPAPDSAVSAAPGGTARGAGGGPQKRARGTRAARPVVRGTRRGTE
ncbi:hypothetical protein ACFV4J_13405, partial [Streptomyces mirabilis]